MPKNNEHDTFFPLPQGDVGLFNPDGFSCTDGFKVRSNIADAMGINTQYSNAMSYGWYGHQGVGTGDSCGDVTSATPRADLYAAPFMSSPRKRGY